MDLKAGSIVAHRYEVIAQLGQGGLARTWLVIDRHLGEQVVLKVVPGADRTRTEILKSEFRILRGIVHPCLPEVFDVGVLRGAAHQPQAMYYSLRYIKGTTLDEYATGRSWAEVEQAFIDLAHALRLLHKLGIRHGDIKPANVLVEPGGRATLIDLSCGQRASTIQLANGVSGTLGFAAPEVLTGGPVDSRADLYALGVTLARVLERLKGTPPEALSLLATKLMQQDPARRPSEVLECLEVLGADDEPLAPALLLRSSFVGRNKELTQIERLAHGSVGNAAMPIVCVHGPAGVGVSRLLDEAKWRMEESCDVISIAPHLPNAIEAALKAAGLSAAEIHSVDDLVMAYAALNDRSDRIVFVCDGLEELDDHNRRLLEAFARLVDATMAVRLLVGAWSAWKLDGVSIDNIALHGLEEGMLKQWLNPLGNSVDAAFVFQQSDGLPGAVLALCADPSGLLKSQKASRLASSTVQQRFLRLSADQQHLLAELVVWGELAPQFFSPTRLDAYQCLASLAAAHWVERRADGWIATRLASHLQLADMIGKPAWENLHLQCAQALQAKLQTLSLRQMASMLVHLCQARRVEQATERFLADYQQADPSTYVEVAAAILDATEEGRVALACARLFERAGRPEQVLHALFIARRHGLPANAMSDYERMAATALADQGKTKHALRRLRRAARMTADAATRVEVAQELGLVCLKEGRSEEALQVTQKALEQSAEPATRMGLFCNAAMALGYLARFDEASSYAEQAITLSKAIPDAALAYRALSARAFIAFRQGKYAVASTDYGQALAMVQRRRLDEKLIPLLVNFASSCQQTGRLVEALDAYQHAYGLAAALGESNRRARLSYNLSAVYIALGALDRAEFWLERTSAQFAELGPPLRASLRLAQGEVAYLRGNFSHANHFINQSLHECVAHDLLREQAEAHLLGAMACLGLGELAHAKDALANAQKHVEASAAEDLTPRLLILRAQTMMLDERRTEARALCEQAVTAARSSVQKAALAEIEAQAAQLFESLGERGPALAHRDQAKAIVAELARQLPERFAAAFHNHPRWAPTFVSNATVLADDQQGLVKEVRGLRRLLDINRRINQAMTTKEVLRSALDAAIELTGCERGFLILADKTLISKAPNAVSLPLVHLSISVSRNMDHEAAKSASRKFSRSIATRVITTGQPFVAIDAMNDGRLSAQASVHALSLKSVLCVPVRTESEVIGAIYLDTRLRALGFDQRDSEFVSAVADQVGIAILKAKLLEAASRQAETLEGERNSVKQALETTEHRLERLRRVLSDHYGDGDTPQRYPELVGRSPAMHKLRGVLDRIVEVDATVLIQGESGTGKELVARAIHQYGPRSSAPFVPVNCGAFPRSLIEAELFGYQKGAFTGAVRDHDGVFVAADKGTLFLDEIGELPLDMQAKLLRVLQERDVKPLGASRTVPVDVRVLCATNRDLRAEVAAGRFREDLYYRVAVIEISLPSLRERIEDVPVLGEHILHKHAAQAKADAPELSSEALRSLMSYHWPGNVRQLENVLVRAALLADGAVIRAVDLALGPATEVALANSASMPEKQRLRAALSATDWNVVEAAKLLAMPRATFYRKLQRYRIERPV